jgi:hypothetical protein
MKRNRLDRFSKTIWIVTLAGTLTSANVFAGGGGSGWTQCSAKEVGYTYSFRGYTQDLDVGEMLTVFVNTATSREYGQYLIEYIDLSQNIGTIELNYAPNENHTNRGTDFGHMKIEYLSSSALKDIRVTFTKDGHGKSSSVTCITD